MVCFSLFWYCCGSLRKHPRALMRHKVPDAHHQLIAQSRNMAGTNNYQPSLSSPTPHNHGHWCHQTKHHHNHLHCCHHHCNHHRLYYLTITTIPIPMPIRIQNHNICFLLAPIPYQFEILSIARQEKGWWHGWWWWMVMTQYFLLMMMILMVVMWCWS